VTRWPWQGILNFGEIEGRKECLGFVNVSTTRKKWKQRSIKSIYTIALEIIFIFVNLSKHTFIIYIYCTF
jgi:hypothetical protein